MRKIKLLIIEDSRLYQAYMARVLGLDEQIEISGIAGTAAQALELIEKDKPDVITLDLGLPDVKEFEFLQTLVSRCVAPIIVVTSIPQMCERALSLGAADFIEKIQSGEKHAAEQFTLLLKLKIKMQASSFRGKNTGRVVASVSRNLRSYSNAPSKENLIVMAASLGGTEATLEILKDLPVWTPGIVVVQHMPPGFTKAYAMRLDNHCELKVKEARNGDCIERGTVLIAKGGEQLSIRKGQNGYHVRLRADDENHTFCPSADVLFESTAEAAGERAVGVILTGMGYDGAEGLRRMHDAGAYTIGQNEETCAVFGMPRAASEVGAVDILLPKQEIAEHLIKKFEK